MERLVPVQVELEGQDARQVKVATSAFSVTRDGRTTLSASGVLVQGPAACMNGTTKGANPVSGEAGSSSQPHAMVLVPAHPIFRKFLRRDVTPESSIKSACAAGGYKHADLLPDTRIFVCLREDVANKHQQKQQQHKDCAVLQRRQAKLAGSILIRDAVTLLQALSEGLRDGVENTGSWTFGWSIARPQSTQDAVDDLMATFMVLFLLMPSLGPKLSKTVHSFSTQRYASCVNAGQLITLVGSPFGCLARDHFLNSTINGVIANTIIDFRTQPQRLEAIDGSAASGSDNEREPAILMLDAHCFPGMEGCVVARGTCALGLLITPLCNAQNRVQAPLTVCMPLVLQALHAWLTSSDSCNADSRHKHALGRGRVRYSTVDAAQRCTEAVEHGSSNSFSIPLASASLRTPETTVKGDSFCKATADPACTREAHCPSNVAEPSGVLGVLQSVVLVRWRHSWASGVIISRGGVVLTNAHLFQASAGPDRQSRQQDCWVRVTSASSKVAWHRSTVLYIFQESHLDVAVLQIMEAPKALCAINLIASEDELLPGAPVYAVSFGLMGARLNGFASITSGNIAQVVKANGCTTMLITTAAVYGGSSGGAMVDAQGRCLGLITSNTKFQGMETLPHLSFCIPYPRLQSIWDWALQQRLSCDIEALKRLDLPDEESSRLWALASVTPEQPTVPPTLQRLEEMRSKLYPKAMPDPHSKL